MVRSDKENPLAASLRLLSYRDRSVRGMEDKLSEKGFSVEEIAEVIVTLTGEGLLDDRRFAGELAASRIKNKNWGPRKIVYDLRRKGIPPEIVDSVLGEIDEKAVALSAKRALEKWTAKKGLGKSGLNEKAFAAACRHLEGRGFGRGLILKLIYPLRETGAVE